MLTAWRSFVSWGTLWSGLLALAAWGLVADWKAGAFVVVMLYIHEAGHVLAAQWRRVPVERQPSLVPGFAAVVPKLQRVRPWDRAWIQFGGPLAGAAAAVAARAAGLAWDMPSLAFAGDFSLLLSAVSLLPYGPLDGAALAGYAGWAGFAAAAGLTIFWISSAGDLILSLLLLAGLVPTFRAVRRSPAIRWGTQVHILVIHILFTLVILALIGSGQPVPAPPGPPRAWLPGPGQVLLLVLVLYVAGLALMPYAWRPQAGARARYVVAGLLGWPQHIAANPWGALAMAYLGLYTLGLPGLRWVQRMVADLAPRGHPAAGSACGLAYDCLYRQGAAAEAQEWLEVMGPAVQAAGPEAVQACAGQLEALGYGDVARWWTDRFGGAS